MIEYQHFKRFHNNKEIGLKQQLLINFRVLIVLIFLLTAFVCWMNSGIYAKIGYPDKLTQRQLSQSSQFPSSSLLSSSSSLSSEKQVADSKKSLVQREIDQYQKILPGSEQNRKNHQQWWEKNEQNVVKQVSITTNNNNNNNFVQSRSIVANDYQIIEDAFCFCNCEELDQYSIFDVKGGKEQIGLNPGGPSNYLNQIFDQIYIINYDKNERRDYIKGIMRFLGIQSVIVDAVPPSDKNVENYLKQIQGSFIYRQIWKISPISIDEIARRLSHFRVFEDVIYNKYSSVLILEDDVDFSAEIGKIALEINKQIQKNWDFIFFGHCQEATHENYQNNQQFIQKADFPKCMHAYAMHGYEIAKKMMKDLDREKNVDFGEAIQNAMKKENMEGVIITPPPIYLIKDQQNNNNNDNYHMQNSIRLKIKQVLRASEVPDCYVQLFRD
eukprot:TRINITY_DN7427_c0_g4_i1.p1 TRINITY_DN7427_c0_g4~~TRINITY_DN7427_c0_g4_i1.p1  ORF type:complete len:489 (-),score=84.60 TRINITY_DN7427_c0_g4_i1:519-1841(-)